MRYFVTILLIAFVTIGGIAQDKQFSQFYAAPLTLNPALTGAFGGTYRISGIYRSQWASALDQAYTTFASAVDLRFPLNFVPGGKDALGVGIVFFTDQVNGFDFNTNQIALSFSYHKSMDPFEKHFISAGFQLGLNQRNINYENLFFDDQFDGLGSYDRPTQEIFSENNFSYSDMSAGLNYTLALNKGARVFAGVGYFHFNNPNISFSREEDPAVDIPLDSKINAQLSARIPLQPKLHLLPRVLFTTQGQHGEFNAGTNLRMAISRYGDTALHLGSWFRAVKSIESSFEPNAVVVFSGFEFNNFLVGVSFDMNIDDVINYQQGMNTFEFSLAYLGNYENESILCPKF